MSIFQPVSKLNRAEMERSIPLSQRSGCGEERGRFNLETGISLLAAVCDFSSAGTVLLAHVAGAEKIAA
jgi:hypothetical protein